MVLIIIATIAGISISLYRVYNSYCFEDFIDYVFGFLWGAFVGVSMGFIVAWILPMDLYDKHYSLNIETLQDNNSVSGQFFLGSGQIDGKMKYVFYYEENGFYRMMQIDYNLVQIKYSDGIPKVNVTEVAPTDSFINNFAFDFLLHSKSYIIEVPKGTIKNNYNLDAQ